MGNNETFIKFINNFGPETMSYYDQIKKSGWKFGGIYTIVRPVLVVVDPDYIRDILTKVRDLQTFIYQKIHLK